MISRGYHHSGVVLQPDSLIQQFRANPPGKLFCLHGSNLVFRLSLHAAAQALLNGSTIALVDGTNRFEPYFIAEFARRVSAKPDDLLKRIFIARSFTCYQMEATITNRLPEFLSKSNSKIVIILGLLDTYYDEQAPMFEVVGSVKRVICALQRLKQSNISVLLASRDVKLQSKERSRLMPQLLSAMDQVYGVEEDGRLR